MKKPRIFLAIFLLPAITLCAGGSFAQTLCSVQELSSTVPTRLQGTFKTPSGSLAVDAEIEPPILVKQPIVKVKKAELPPKLTSVWPEGSTFFADAKTQKNPWGRFSVSRQFPSPYDGIDLRAHSALLKPWSADKAENSPITATEASSIADELIAVCMANMADQGYRLYGRAGATSAYYHFDDASQTYMEQLTDTGFYHVTAYQVFHGAALFNRGQYYWTVTYENEWVEININAQTGACLYPEDRSVERNTFRD